METESQKALELLKKFFDQGREITYDRRETIVGYPAANVNIYFIASGNVKVVSYTNTGNERIHYIYKPEEFFPITSVFGRKSYEVNFIALTETVVKSRSVQEFHEFVNKHPLVLARVVEQQMDLLDRFINLNAFSSRQRVAHRLLGFGDRFGCREEDHYVIKFHMTIQEIADNVSLSRETTGRILKKFEEDGLIVMGRQKMIVYPDKLALVLDH
jgi:CRP-like cAMP-binding protein